MVVLKQNDSHTTLGSEKTCFVDRCHTHYILNPFMKVDGLLDLDIGCKCFYSDIHANVVHFYF